MYGYKVTNFGIDFCVVINISLRLNKKQERRMTVFENTCGGGEDIWG